MLNDCILFALTPVMILFGPPGSGKGTFSQYLKEHYDYSHLSIGDALRNEVVRQTKLGREIEEKIKKGEYIDPKIVHDILAEHVRNFQKQNIPFILDGFGQNPEDAKFMENLLREIDLFNQTMIVYLQASDAACCNRIKDRMICALCGHVYNAATVKPISEEICDLCGGELKRRLNDGEEVTMKRLKHHRDGVEGYYKEALSLFPSIIYDANSPVEACYQFCDQIAQQAKNFPEDSLAFTSEFK